MLRWPITGHLIPQAQLAAFRAANPDFNLQAIESTNGANALKLDLDLTMLTQWIRFDHVNSMDWCQHRAPCII